MVNITAKMALFYVLTDPFTTVCINSNGEWHTGSKRRHAFIVVHGMDAPAYQINALIERIEAKLNGDVYAL